MSPSFPSYCPMFDNAILHQKWEILDRICPNSICTLSPRFPCYCTMFDNAILHQKREISDDICPNSTSTMSPRFPCYCPRLGNAISDMKFIPIQLALCHQVFYVFALCFVMLFSFRNRKYWMQFSQFSLHYITLFSMLLRYVW